MAETKIRTGNPGYIEVSHKDKIINLPISIRFDAGEILLSDISKESIKIKEYIGSTGEIIAGGIKIGDGIVLDKNTHARIKMKILPKNKLAEVLEKSRVHITCVLDTFLLPADTIEELGHGSIIPLKDTMIGAPLSLLINGYKMADGELCSVGDRFGLRIIEIVDPDTENIILPRTGDEPEAYCCIMAGQRETTVKELYSIGEGTIVQFDDPVSDLFPLIINGHPSFLVEIMSEGENINARIYDPEDYKKYILKEKPQAQPGEEQTPLKEKGDTLPFHFITETEALLFHTLFAQEHPQTLAVILSCLPPKISRIALLSLPIELKADVTQRIAGIKKVKAGTLHHIEKYVKEKIDRIPPTPVQESGGIEHTIEIFKGIVDDERKKILDILEQNNKSLADKIKKRLS
jgi:flagellar motor switch/type III secretory pathway protein FliN